MSGDLRHDVISQSDLALISLTVFTETADV